MAKKPKKAPAPVRRGSKDVRVRRVADRDEWEFLHPRCAVERGDDMEEVRTMLEHGENDVAVEEMRWLLSGCSDFMDAHRQLGELALADGDIALARGHFGHAFRVGVAAWQRAGKPRPVPYVREANRAFFESGKGLIYCLLKLNNKKLAAEVVQQLVDCDKTDPLNVRSLLSDAGESKSE